MSQTHLTPRPVAKAEDVQEQYNQHKDRLVDAIDSTKSILDEIRVFNKDDWVVRYPQLREDPTAPDTLRRSLSFADDPASQTSVKLGLTRSVTLASLDAAKETETEVETTPNPAPLSSDFHVLRLDLKLGSTSSANSAASLVSQLEKSSIAHLLDERLAASIAHIDKLRLRVQDTSSKVLVTGDLNAGKSTLVNSLLRRPVMPVDQQPCTTAFCEVHDATENNGVEAVHIVKLGTAYNVADETTYTTAAIEDLEEIVAEYETKDPDHLLKVYLAGKDQNSLLSNGTVNISLIDAPGLNRDSLKTTALFARQEEIDVVVFVVSAENHFTLSAKEFLWTASNEKAYLFIVVNKYDMIRNKDKCRRVVLEQIKGLSPRTYEDASDLVHFVDSASAAGEDENKGFGEMEAALRPSCTPVETFLLNLLSDIELLASANKLVAESELAQARAELAEAKPVLEKMRSGRDKFEDSLESIEEEGVRQASAKTKKVLADALEQVGSGKPFGGLQLPSYPGLFAVWDYARDVRRTLLESLDQSVKLAEDEARTITSAGVAQIKDVGEEHLPAGVERSRRVFMPEAMFSAVRRGKGSGANGVLKKRNGNAVIVAGGAHGLGIGLSARPDMQETTFFDLFDVHHQFWVHFGDDKSSSEMDTTPGALSVVGVGVGALTMVGGQAIGVRGVIEGIVRLSDFFGNETARKWALPVVGAVTIGAAVYVVLELPSSIPRTVGRRIKAAVEAVEDDEKQWEAEHVVRVGRETRKVLRLASWDLRERFRGAMEERGKEVKNAEEGEKRALKAQEWFGSVGSRVGEVRGKARLGEESVI
ncbi:Transmembrane GTPase [Mycena sanguinolenta]|uniref:Transmembrane GTPase n=1 Tax=Mycena sanguinolenta TaxID=230812 RepID=A0A8H6Z4M9_9AGAR|nr:Transmembrane GTPase [Mycena sanguinolenta]